MATKSARKQGTKHSAAAKKSAATATRMVGGKTSNSPPLHKRGESGPHGVPFIQPDSLPAATLGTPYSAGLHADQPFNNGTPPYTFSMSGTLPGGITFAQTDALNATFTGTPTESGAFSFTVQATDANGTPERRSYTINVQPAATRSLTPTKLPAKKQSAKHTAAAKKTAATATKTVRGGASKSAASGSKGKVLNMRGQPMRPASASATSAKKSGAKKSGSKKKR